MSSSSFSSTLESDTLTTPASTPVKLTPVGTKSSPVAKVQPYYIEHKRDQVQDYDSKVQNLEDISSKEFLNILNVDLPTKLPKRLPSGSIANFCKLANEIARSIKAKHFPTRDLLVFKENGNHAPDGHVSGTKCRPDIIAAFEKDYVAGEHTDWALIRLAGEKASKGRSQPLQSTQAATYLHYLLLARPDFLVAQGLLTTKSKVEFLLGIGGFGIKRLVLKWNDNNLKRIVYASVYRLYEPSFFADPSYEMTGFDKKTSEAIYTMRFKMKEYSGFRPIHARNPFANRTHVLSNPLFSQGEDGEDGPTVFKEQFCRIGRRFDEPSILTKIHGPKNVPGVVEAVLSESNGASTLSPERKRYFLGLRQTGSPFTSIPTAKKMLETSFDLLEVLRFLYFERSILHRDISAGNVMYIENPEDPQTAVEQLVFAKHLLGESDVRHKTSLLLVDFNLGEDLLDRTDRKRIDRTGTPIFISRAAERGRPAPLTGPCRVPAVPKIPTPTCYSECHPERIELFPENTGSELIEGYQNQSQFDSSDSSTYDWKHQLDHDVESVFWLVVYWAMVMQPKGQPGGYIHSPTWGNLIGDSEDRDLLLVGLSRGSSTLTLTHAVYQPLCSLIQNLAKVLMVERHWLPESSVQNQPDYICEAFQRIILEFITSHRDEDFMTCPVGDSLRQTRPNAQSQALSITPSQARDGSIRAVVNELKRCSGTKDEADQQTDDDESYHQMDDDQMGDDESCQMDDDQDDDECQTDDQMDDSV